MKTIVFPKFPEKFTVKSLNGLLGELASFASAENINALDDDKMDDFRGAFRAFNSRMHDMVVAVGREIVSQIPEVDYALFKKLLDGEKKGTLNRAGRIRLNLLRKRLKEQKDASAYLFFVRYMTERHLWYTKQVEHALSHKYINGEALFKLLPVQLEDMRVMLSAFSGEDRIEDVSGVEAALEKKDAKALLAHVRSLVEVLHKGSKNLSGMLPNLDELISAANALLPKTFTDKAEADTGSLIKTFLVWFAVVSVVYWLYYFIATGLAENKITRALWNPVRKVIYPPLYPENLNPWLVQDMMVTMFLMAVAIASIVVVLKSRGKRPQPA